MSEPPFSSFGSGIPSPVPQGALLRNRLIPQEGIRRTRDEQWQTDTLTVPFKCYRPDLPGVSNSFPARFSTLLGYPNMFFDRVEITHGKVMADVVFSYMGSMETTFPTIKPDDSMSLQSVQITVPDSQAIADFAFIAPQTVWRWIAREDADEIKNGYPPSAYRDINNPPQIVVVAGQGGILNQTRKIGRFPYVVRYNVRTDPNAVPADFTPDNIAEVRSFTADPFGTLRRCSATVIRTLKAPGAV